MILACLCRHEAAIALGVMGSKKSRETLEKALDDPDEPVRDSAVVALSNLGVYGKVEQERKIC